MFHVHQVEKDNNLHDIEFDDLRPESRVGLAEYGGRVIYVRQTCHDYDSR